MNEKDENKILKINVELINESEERFSIVVNTNNNTEYTFTCLGRFDLIREIIEHLNAHMLNEKPRDIEVK